MLKALKAIFSGRKKDDVPDTGPEQYREENETPDTPILRTTIEIAALLEENGRKRHPMTPKSLQTWTLRALNGSHSISQELKVELLGPDHWEINPWFAVGFPDFERKEIEVTLKADKPIDPETADTLTARSIAHAPDATMAEVNHRADRKDAHERVDADE